ncbi:hypothetical protein IAR55_001658 [Kwoniella newhampshirensis]|uniref:Uncharacterized protein n=1 Tax=Kwoniella newhampshirensis TaxID=1651941 RepID=A0AAW0Z2R8_9TREE
MHALAPFLLLPALFVNAQELSCSPEASDSCQVPHPGGLFVFRQRFEPDVGSDHGSWGIDGLDVLTCDTQLPQNTTAYAATYTHEEIGSFCHKSPLFGGESGFNQAEKDWAQSEVGEGFEEVWERAWNTAGRFISTFDPKCSERPVVGQGVSEFFITLRKLHQTFTTAQLLAEADITPSDDTTYSLSELSNALATGEYRPIVTCDNSTLSSVLWPLYIRGAFHAGTFEASTTYRHPSNCPSEGILYPPSTTIPKPTQAAEWDILRRPPPRPITLTHDESRMYYRSKEEDPKMKLGLFKDYDEGKDEMKEERATKQFHRDEL